MRALVIGPTGFVKPGQRIGKGELFPLAIEGNPTRGRKALAFLTRVAPKGATLVVHKGHAKLEPHQSIEALVKGSNWDVEEFGGNYAKLLDVARGCDRVVVFRVGQGNHRLNKLVVDLQGKVNLVVANLRTVRQPERAPQAWELGNDGAVCKAPYVVAPCGEGLEVAYYKVTKAPERKTLRMAVVPVDNTYGEHTVVLARVDDGPVVGFVDAFSVASDHFGLAYAEMAQAFRCQFNVVVASEASVELFRGGSAASAFVQVGDLGDMVNHAGDVVDSLLVRHVEQFADCFDMPDPQRGMDLLVDQYEQWKESWSLPEKAQDYLDTVVRVWEECSSKEEFLTRMM